MLRRSRSSVHYWFFGPEEICHLQSRHTSEASRIERRRGHSRSALLRYGDAKVVVSPLGGDAAAARALDEAALEQIRLVDVFDRIARLA